MVAIWMCMKKSEKVENKNVDQDMSVSLQYVENPLLHLWLVFISLSISMHMLCSLTICIQCFSQLFTRAFFFRSQASSKLTQKYQTVHKILIKEKQKFYKYSLNRKISARLSFAGLCYDILADTEAHWLKAHVGSRVELAVDYTPGLFLGLSLMTLWWQVTKTGSQEHLKALYYRTDHSSFSHKQQTERKNLHCILIKTDMSFNIFLKLHHSLIEYYQLFQ